MKRTRIDSVRESLRLQQVYNVFLRYGWDLAFQRWRLLGTLRHNMQRWVWHLPDLAPGAYQWGVILYRTLPEGGWENLKVAGGEEEVAVGGTIEVGGR